MSIVSIRANFRTIIRFSQKFTANFQAIIRSSRNCTDDLPTVFCRASTSSSWWWWVLCFRRAWTSSASWILRSYCCFIWRNLEMKKYSVNYVYRNIFGRTRERSLVYASVQNDFKGEKERIWKRSFISTVRSTVHTNPSRKSELFENPLQTRKNWKLRRCVVVGTENILKTKLQFQKLWLYDYHDISLPEF